MNIPSNLTENDAYSMLLFLLYRLRDVPEYSALSELMFILDKDSVLKLFEYFGGLTITIPTIHDLEVLVYALILYKEVNINKKSFENVITSFNQNKVMNSEIADVYIKLETVLNGYKFNKV